MRLRPYNAGYGFLIGAWLFVTSMVGAQPAPGLQDPFEGVDVDEQLGAVIPTDLVFFNEQGESVQLNSYFEGKRAVMLTLVYHECPMLCNLFLDGVTESLQDLAWTPGREFDILTVSFSPTETPELAARQKAAYIDKLGRSEAAAGWHFLTGDQEAITTLADAVGFRYRWDERSQQYAHPPALIFLTAEGQIMRYLYGIKFPVMDLRNALVETSEGRIGTTLDKLILYCFQYDPHAQSYVLHAMNLMKLGGLLTMLVLGTFLFIFWRREGRSGMTPEATTV